MQTGQQRSSSGGGRAMVEDDWSWLARDLALSPRELKRGASAFVPQAHNSTSSISHRAVPQLPKQPSSSTSNLLQFLGNNFSSKVAPPPATTSFLLHQQPADVETNAASTLLQQLQPSNKVLYYNHVNSKIPSTAKVSDASSYNKYIVEDDRHRFPPTGGNENDSRAGNNIGRRGQARMVLGQQLRTASTSSTTPTKKPVTMTSMPTDVIHKTDSSSTASTALSISSSTSTITAQTSTFSEPTATFSEFVKLNEYKTIHEVIEVAYEHENLSPKHMSAVWTSLSRLVIASTRHQFREIPQNWIVLEGKLSTLVDRMIASLQYYTPIFITQSALSIGKIIKTVSNVTTTSGGNNHKTIHMFRTVLVGKNDTDIQKTKIYQAIATTTVPLLNQFDAQGFSNMTYACAITKTIPRCHGRSLFDHITDAICLLDSEAMQTFTPQNLTNIVWAFATAKIFSQRVFGKILCEISQRDFSTFEQQHLSNVVWAYARSESSPTLLFDKCAKEVVRRNEAGEEFSPQVLTNLAWSFTTAMIGDESLFKAVAAQIDTRSHLRAFKPQELANLVWAFAASAMFYTPLAVKLFDKVAVDMSSDKNGYKAFSPHHMSIIAWSFAAANVHAPRLFNTSFINALMYKMDGFSPPELCQLHQFNLWQKFEKRGKGLPPVLANRCYKAFVNSNQQSRQFSIQRDVIQTLHSMGLKPKADVMTKQGYHVDVMVELEDGKQVSIEANVRRHLIGKKPTGSTLLKRRQIANVEWIKLVNIVHWDWEQLGQYRGQQGRAKKQSFLRGMLGIPPRR